MAKKTLARPLSGLKTYNQMMAVMISEKRVRQMYNLIDGKKTLSELALLTRMSQKEILEALQSLLAQGHIRLRDAGGNPVDIAPMLSSM